MKINSSSIVFNVLVIYSLLAFYITLFSISFLGYDIRASIALIKNMTILGVMLLALMLDRQKAFFFALLFLTILVAHFFVNNAPLSPSWTSILS